MRPINLSLIKGKQTVFVALLLNLLILRVNIPYLEYLFVLFAFASILLLLPKRWRISNEFYQHKKSFKILLPYIGITILFIFSFIFTKDKPFLLYREFIVSLFFIYYFFLSFNVLDSTSKRNLFFDKFKEQFIAITAFAALSGVIKIVLGIAGIELTFLTDNGFYPIGTSLKTDHNFYSLGIAIGFVFVSERLARDSSRRWSGTVLLILYSFNIIFSSSRRGIVLLFTIHLVILLFGFMRLWSFHVLMKNLKVYFFLFTLVLAVSVLCIYTYGRNYGDFNFKQQVATIASDYQSIISNRSNFVETYNSIWNSDYIEDWRINQKKMKSKDKSESQKSEVAVLASYPVKISETTVLRDLENGPGWRRWMAMRTEKVRTDTYNLLRVEGFHPGACLFRFFNLDTTVTDIFVSMNIKIVKWNKVQRVELRTGQKKTVKYLTESLANEKWNFIDLHLPVDSSDKVQLLLYFTGSGVEEYGEVLLQGLTLSGYPFHDESLNASLNKLNQLVIDPGSFTEDVNMKINIDTVPWSTGPNLFMDTISVRGNDVIYTYSDSLAGYIYKDINIPKSRFWKYSASLFPYKAGRNLRIETRNLTSDNYTKGVYYPDRNSSGPDSLEWKRLETTFYAEQGDVVRIGVRLFPDTIPQLVFWSDFRLTTYSYADSFEKPDFKPDQPNIRAIAQQIEKKKKIDSSNHQMQADNFLYPRIQRWKFAVDIFKTYPLIKKIFGGGFEYLRKYDKKFPSQPGYIKVEYPHNIFLSVLLYSGLFGLIVFFWLMYATVKLYLIHRLNPLFLAWLMIFSFVIFSSDTIFELPLFTGFTILPFIYHIATESKKSSDITKI